MSRKPVKPAELVDPAGGAAAGAPMPVVDPVLALIMAARTNFAAFVSAVHRPRFQHSHFSLETCRAVDQFVEDVIAGKRPVLDLTAPPQHGKLLHHDTPVLTANRGWITHGALRVGDLVFRPDGSTTPVVALSEEQACDAVVVFSDGTELVTHSRHEWQLHRTWLNGRTAKVLETRDIAAKGVWAGARGRRGSRANFQLPAVAPLAGPDADLPLHPYVLGAWLGDGTRTKPAITLHPTDRAAIEAIEACGHPITRTDSHRATGALTATFASLAAPLRALGLLNPTYAAKGGWIPKTIPDVYYTASTAQRLELLAGLLDTDGYVYPQNGRITFSTCEPELARSVARLVATFGWRVTTTWFEPKTSTSGIHGRKPVAQVCWQNTLRIPCRLGRKRDAQLLDRMERKRNVTDVRFGSFGLGRCIQVGHEDGMYLAGDTLVPTHNSSLTSRCLPGYLIGRLGPVLGQCRIALSSYALSRAKANARDAKGYMLEPIYREIFPHASLIGFKGVNTADEFHHPFGFVKAQGAGGSLTGFSIDCFAPDTLVSTSAGPIRIDQLHLHAKTVKVLCHDGKELRYAGIKAIAHRQATRLYRITTESGRVLEVTGNHPVFCAGAWRPAAELTPGDVLLCAVPQSGDAHGRGLREAESANAERAAVLQQGVCPSRGQHVADVSGLRQAYGRLRARSLQALPSCAPAASNRGRCGQAADAVLAVWRAVCVGLARRLSVVLQQGVREWGTRRSHAGRSEPELARRAGQVAQAHQAARATHVPLCATGNAGPRSSHVPAMRTYDALGSASHRPRPDEQCVVQFTDLVSPVPHAPPSRATDARAESDRVRSVEVVDGPVRVFDVQVQAHACLFANGILAHNCAINDDLTKDAQEALSTTVQDGLEDWYDSVLSTRLQERSGQVNIGTPWSANDIMARIHAKHKDGAAYRRLQFVALNLPDQVGYNPDQPEGPLVPQLHSESKLREICKTLAAMWWAAMFQQAPLAELGSVFSKAGVRYYFRKDLPAQFVQVVMSVDATFKDNKGSDYVFVGVWGKSADERVWLLDFRREKLAFTKTAQAITDLKAAHPRVSKIYIEDAANGPALIDMLSKHVTGIVGVPPLGSKEARAHAVSWVWDNGCVMLPSPTEVPTITPIVTEITSFPDVRNDDAVDGMTIALYQLCLRNPISAMITNDILRMAGRPHR